MGRVVVPLLKLNNEEAGLIRRRPEGSGLQFTSLRSVNCLLIKRR